MKKRKWIVVTSTDTDTDAVDYIGYWENTPTNAKAATDCYFAYLRKEYGEHNKVRKQTVDELPAGFGPSDGK
jgi:hypothetical protein